MIALTPLICGVACSIAELDETGLACTDHCAGGLQCIDGHCAVARADASANADTGPSDGSPEADRTDAPSFFCTSLSPPRVFCDDFDQGALASKWTTVHPPSTGSLGPDNSDSVGPPLPGNSLRVMIPDGGGPDQNAFVSFDYARGTNAPRLAYDVKVSEVPPGGDLTYLSTIKIGNHAAILFVFQNILTLREDLPTDGGVRSVDHMVSGIVPKKWTHIDITLSISLASKATVSVDGVVALDAASLDSSWSVAPPTVIMGWAYVYAFLARTIAWDNVTFDAP